MWVRKRQRIRYDANNRVRLAIELHDLTEHPLVRGEALTPQTFGQHDDGGMVDGILLFEQRPDERTDVERTKHAWRRDRDSNPVRIAAA